MKPCRRCPTGNAWPSLGTQLRRGCRPGHEHCTYRSQGTEHQIQTSNPLKCTYFPMQVLKSWPDGNVCLLQTCWRLEYMNMPASKGVLPMLLISFLTQGAAKVWSSPVGWEQLQWATQLSQPLSELIVRCLRCNSGTSRRKKTHRDKPKTGQVRDRSFFHRHTHGCFLVFLSTGAWSKAHLSRKI